MPIRFWLIKMLLAKSEHDIVMTALHRASYYNLLYRRVDKFCAISKLIQGLK